MTLSLQTKVLSTLGNQTCDTILAMRNIFYLSRLTLIHIENKENPLEALKLSLNVQEEELTSANLRSNPVIATILEVNETKEDEFTEEELKKNNSAWGIIKSASDRD